jgi:hypothetical protein
MNPERQVFWFLMLCAVSVVVLMVLGVIPR